MAKSRVHQLSKTKGKVFERKVATAIRRARNETASVVRRTIQSDRPYEPDVVVEGSPLWVECTDARNPDFVKKYKQARRDADQAESRRKYSEPRHPVVVWHRLAEKRIWATMRASTFQVLQSGVTLFVKWTGPDPLITLDFNDFLELPGVCR